MQQEYYPKPSWIKHAIVGLLLIAFVLWLTSCSTQRYGCYATRGFVGYHSR